MNVIMYWVMIRVFRVICTEICIGHHVLVPDNASLKGLTSYDTILSILHISYSFVDRQHKIIEMSVIILPDYMQLHTRRLQSSQSFPWEPQIFYCLIDNDNILYHMCQCKNHVSAYRGTGWVLSRLSGITVLCTRSLIIRGSGTACECVGCVCWDQDSAHRRRVLDVLMYFRILEKTKNFLYISKKHVSAKTDYNPAS
jgi:hypothetical protein